MNFGYLACHPDTAEIFQAHLMKQGAERVIIDYNDDNHHNDHKQLPILLEGLVSGDSLYVRNLFDLSGDTQVVKDILQVLQDHSIKLFVNGEYIDFANPLMQFELAKAFAQQDEAVQTIKMAVAFIREERKARNKLATLRQQSGMTQKAFAEYFDIPQRTVENWEGGQRGCPKYLLKLMQYKLINEGIINEIKPIVDKETWEAAQTHIKDKSKVPAGGIYKMVDGKLVINEEVAEKARACIDYYINSQKDKIESQE